MSFWVIRLFFLLLCVAAGYAVSQYRPEIIEGGAYGVTIGFGLGGLLIALDEMLKGFSLRAFSAATFGLALGTLVAAMVNHTGLFIFTDEKTQWLLRLTMFLGFGYLGMILAIRSNKEDFALIIPYIRFRSQNKPENHIVLDTSVIIDGRIADLVDNRFVEGILVIPKFVLRELQFISDSHDATRRARGRRGLEVLNRLRQNPRSEVRVHEMDFPEEKETDAKLLKLTRALDGRLFTNDFNLGKIAEIQGVPHVNLNSLAAVMKPAIHPGDVLRLRVVREGRDKGQGVAYLPDGTMVVINGAQSAVGQSIDAEITTQHQTGAGIIFFAEHKTAQAA